MKSDQHTEAAPLSPIAANAALYDPKQAEQYLAMLFRHVDWQPGQVISLLGIGEKGTPQEGLFRERKIIAPAFMGAAHAHLKRWAGHQVAGFIVPAALHPAAAEKGDVTLDKVAALTALILDIDSGDVTKTVEWATERLGRPSMIVASGGTTDAGKLKAHLYWLLTEPQEDVERVAAVRKLLAAKTGGDQSFGRATQVIRVPGSVHAKDGKAKVCRILDRSGAEYDFDELAETVEAMQPMAGIEAPAAPLAAPSGMMDFAPNLDTALAALHRDVAAGGDDLTRWGEFSKVAGFNISEARAGRLTPEAAYIATNGWMLSHMDPPWPQARFDQEFKALVKKDSAHHGPLAASGAVASNFSTCARLPLEYFRDISASLTNAFLIRGWLACSGLAAIYGFPGSGKSFLAIDMSLRIALGWPVDGRPVQQSPVIYIAAEGQNGVRNRVAAFRQYHSVEADLPFALIPSAIDLLDPTADVGRLIEAISEAVTHFGQPPGLIVVDTLAATFGGGDENTSAMIAYINNLAKLRDVFGATVAVVHHRPKDATNNTPRGHGSLMGAMDTIILVEDGRDRIASVMKQKDAEAGTPIAFELKVVTLGLDEDGEPVSAAVVNYRDRQSDKDLAAGPAAVLKALTEAIDLAGGQSVSEAVWRSKWAEQADIAEKSDDTRRKAWARCRDGLSRANRVQTRAGQWSIHGVSEDSRSMDFSIGAGL